MNDSALMRRVFEQLGLTVLERGWLSSNNVVFAAEAGAGVTVIDTGYDSHSAQTLALLESALAGAPVERVINTHLHSDHCGGNAALQQVWNTAVWVPEASFDAARHWDASKLSFDATDQRCQRFAVQAPIGNGQCIDLAGAGWQVIAAPGHDAEAVMLFQPDSGVLISADALWEERLAIIFPELDGGPGFADARAALHCIEALQPRIVIPGHGRPFTDVAGALSRSRQRLDHFERYPEKHARYAMRALLMFHLLERQRREFDDLVDWLLSAAVFWRAHHDLKAQGSDPRAGAEATVRGLQRDGLLEIEGSIIRIR